MKNGTYTVEVALDTKTAELGTLSSKRQVTIEYTQYDKLFEQCMAATAAHDSAKACKISQKALTKWFKRTVKPGQACSMDKPAFGKDPGRDKLTGVVKWYPGKESLKVVADVTDISFAPNVKTATDGSSFQVYVSPTGFDDAMNRYTIIPSGPENAPVVQGAGSEKIKATWKRSAKGYKVEANIPYDALNGYKPGWKLMAVEAGLTAKPSENNVMLLTGKTRPVTIGQIVFPARCFAVLSAK